jgi:hypothetical protein
MGRPKGSKNRVGVAKKTPRRPRVVVRARGSKLDFTTLNVGEITEREREIVTCSECSKSGELSIWRGGEAIIVHRGMEQDGKFRMTEYCYIGLGGQYGKRQFRERVATSDGTASTSADVFNDSAKPEKRKRKTRADKGKPRGKRGKK